MIFATGRSIMCVGRLRGTISPSGDLDLGGVSNIFKEQIIRVRI